MYFNALKCVFTGALCKAFTEGTYSSSSLFVGDPDSPYGRGLFAALIYSVALCTRNNKFRSTLNNTCSQHLNYTLIKSLSHYIIRYHYLCLSFSLFGFNSFGPGAAVAWSKIYALKGSSKFLSLRGSRALSARWGPKKSPTHPCIAFLTSS